MKTLPIIGLIVIILLGGILGGTVVFSGLAPSTSKQLSFIATQASTLTNPDTPIEGGYFQFGTNCETMQATTPSLNKDCLAQFQGRPVQQYSTDDLSEQCYEFNLKVNGQNLKFRKGNTQQRQGYSITLLDAKSEWVIGEFSQGAGINPITGKTAVEIQGTETVTNPATGETTEQPNVVGTRTSTQTAGFQAHNIGWSATYQININTDALNITINPTTQTVAYKKTLPACVTTGVKIFDSPRLLGATVINNNDGTYTNLGRLQQSEITFPATTIGNTPYTVAPQLGTHALVIKPYIEANNKLIDFLPEQLTYAQRLSATETKPLNTQEIQQLPQPTLWQRIKAWLKNTFK